MCPYPTQTVLNSLYTYDPTTGHLLFKKTRGGKVVGTRAGSVDSSGHRQVKVQGRLYAEHRIIWVLVNGSVPTCQIHHINKIRDDNRLVNLALAPNNNYDNQQDTNIRKDNTSGVKGVSWNPRLEKWEARLQIKRKKLYLGVFSSLAEASTARKAAEEQHFTFLQSFSV